MVKALLIIAVVVAALIGGILVLRGSSRAGMPGDAVIGRAKERERDIEAREKRDGS
jgi:preprotein translocase subunit SecG